MNKKIALLSNCNDSYVILKNLIDSVNLNDYFKVLKSTDSIKNYSKKIKIEKNNEIKLKDNCFYNFLYKNKTFKLEKRKYVYLNRSNYYFFWIINSCLKGLFSVEKKDFFLREKIFFENYIFNQTKKINISNLSNESIYKNLLHILYKNSNDESSITKKDLLYLEKAITTNSCLNLIIIFLLQKAIYKKNDEKLEKRIDNFFDVKKQFFKKSSENFLPLYSFFCIIYLIEKKKTSKKYVNELYKNFLISFSDKNIQKKVKAGLFNNKKELSATLMELWVDMALIKKERLNTLQYRYSQNYFNFKKIFLSIYYKMLKKKNISILGRHKKKLNITIRFDVDRRVTTQHVDNIIKFKDKFNIGKFAFFLKHDTVKFSNLLAKNFSNSYYGHHFNNFCTDNLRKIKGKSLNFHSGFDSEYFHLNSIKKIITHQPSSIENLNYFSDRPVKLLHLDSGLMHETQIYFSPNYLPIEGSIKDKDSSYFVNIIFPKAKQIFDYSENVVLGTHTDINPNVWFDVIEFLEKKYNLNFI